MSLCLLQWGFGERYLDAVDTIGAGSIMLICMPQRIMLLNWLLNQRTCCRSFVLAMVLQ
jgi:hypothetical protein